jgi:hypothetical protein
MDKPKDFSKSQLEYVEYLEKKVADFSAKKTKVHSYHALKSMVDGLNSLMLEGIELPILDEDGNPTGKTKKYNLLSPESLSSKDDKIFDRIFKFMEKEDSFLSTMDKLADQISPEDIDKEVYASEYEEIIASQENA